MEDKLKYKNLKKFQKFKKNKKNLKLEEVKK